MGLLQCFTLLSVAVLATQTDVAYAETSELLQFTPMCQLHCGS